MWIGLLVLWAVVASQVQLFALGLGFIDNADGFRVLDKAFVERMGPRTEPPLAGHYPMLPVAEVLPIRLVPDSLAGLFALVTGCAAKLMGAERVSMPVLSALYHFLFAAGSVLLVLRVGARWGRVGQWAAGAVLLALFLAPQTSGLFGSVFEEAALVAILPLWAALALGATASARGAVLFAICSGALVYAKPASFLLLLPVFVLIGLRVGGPPTLRRALLASLIAVILLGLGRNAVRFEDYNSFNRLHNGVAYAMAGVSDWQARHFEARLAERAAHVDPATARALGLPEEVVERWGQSYWPYLGLLSRTERRRLAEPGKLGAVLGLIVSEPTIAVAMVREGTLTAMRADYGLDYLTQGGDEGGGNAGWRFGGLGYLLPLLAAGLAVALLCRRWITAAFLLPPLLAPSMIVLADGFYEFEKHMLPYLLAGTISGLAGLALWRDPAGERP